MRLRVLVVFFSNWFGEFFSRVEVARVPVGFRLCLQVERVRIVRVAAFDASRLMASWNSLFAPDKSPVRIRAWPRK